MTVGFANRTEASGTLVVGCDGARSTVRSLLFGAEKATVTALEKTVHANMAFSYNDAEKAKTVRSMHPST